MSVRSLSSSPHLAPLIVGLLVLVPRLATACSVCSAGRDEENRIAFIITTAFMTLLPLLLIGGLAFWLWGRFRALDEQHPGSPAAAESGTEA